MTDPLKPTTAVLSPTPALPPIPRSKPLPTIRRHRLRKTLIGVGIGVVIALLFAGWVIYRAIAVVNTQKLDANGKRLGFFQQLTHIVTASGNELQGESEGRVNMLLMGYGGPGHDGPYLTDTLMVLSYQPTTKKVAMLSIPRDLVVNIPGYDYRKINGVLSIGKDQKYPGGGEALVVKVVSDLLNIPIQYYARIDFSGFEQIIDRLGGVNVTVDRTFADYSYPTENYGYQTIRFTAGPQELNGDLALKFARSRHGNNGEGSDFARAARQQKILVGMREKVLSLGTLLNPLKISDILQALGTHSQTNMEVWEMLRIGNILKDVEPDHMINRVFDDGPKNLLRSATGTGGAYILIPRAATYTDLSFFAQHIFTIAAADTEQVPILVLNRSKQAAVGQNTYQGLTGFGLDMTPLQVGSSSLGKTVIIDTTAGANPATIELLKQYAHTTRVLSPSTWTEATNDPSVLRLLEPPVNKPEAVMPKIILILGLDQPTPPKSIFNVQPKSTNTNTTSNKNSNSNKNTNTSKNSNVNKNANTNSAKNTNANRNTNSSTTNTNS